ncbi:MAG: hypothetical protein AAGA48_29115 [Myxococcota bacterium]
MRPRAWVTTGLNPDVPDEAFCVVVVDPRHEASFHTLAWLGGRAHERDNAFYVLTSDAWHARRGGVVQIWSVESPAPLLVADLPGDAEPFTVLLLVWSALGRDALETALREGTEWPLVVGPRIG